MSLNFNPWFYTYSWFYITYKMQCANVMNEHETLPLCRDTLQTKEIEQVRGGDNPSVV